MNYLHLFSITGINKNMTTYVRVFVKEDALGMDRFIPIKMARHHVSVQRGNYHICDGSIIGPDLVLTNSLCFTAKQVRAGTNVWSCGGTIHTVEEVLTVSNVLPVDDVILLRVSPSFSFGNTTWPIKLSSDELAVNSTVTVTWFQRSENHKLTGKFMTILEKRYCHVDTYNDDSNSLICGGQSEHIDNEVCPVLLGSPVSSNNILFAIGMHRYTNCYLMYNNDLYSNIPYYEKAISELINSMR